MDIIMCDPSFLVCAHFTTFVRARTYSQLRAVAHNVRTSGHMQPATSHYVTHHV